MEKTALINSDYLTSEQFRNSKIIVTRNACFIWQNILIFCIFLIQLFITAYLILLGKFAGELNLYNFNTTETEEYVDKFKQIINYVCDNIVNCTEAN